MITREYRTGLFLDIYTTDTGGKLPVLVMVHGGGFMIGSRSIMHEMACNFSSRGFVCVSPSYSLTKMSPRTYMTFVTVQALVVIILSVTAKSKIDLSVLLFLVIILMISDCLLLHNNCSENPVRHPTHVSDLADAVGWVRSNVHEYGGDGGNIFLIGHSAGGFLVSLLACDRDILAKSGLVQDDIRGVISLSGVFSAQRMQQTFLGRQLYNIVFPTDGGDGFPISKIHSGVPPPHFFINAVSDYTLKRHTLDMFMALRECGVPVRAEVYDKNSHFSIHRYWDGSNRHILESVLKFIEYLLR